jgi:hypothetical protein
MRDGDDGAEAAAAQGGAMATTRPRLREEVRLLRLDDGGSNADQRDPQHILGGRCNNPGN